MITTDKLTKRQLDILNIIKMYIKNYGYSPTMREIAERDASEKKPNGITVKAAYDFVVALERKGYIKKPHGVGRAIVVLDKEVKLV